MLNDDVDAGVGGARLPADADAGRPVASRGGDGGGGGDGRVVELRVTPVRRHRRADRGRRRLLRVTPTVGQHAVSAQTEEVSRLLLFSSPKEVRGSQKYEIKIVSLFITSAGHFPNAEQKKRVTEVWQGLY